MEQDMPTAPVTGFTLGRHLAADAIILRFDLLVSAQSAPNQPRQTPWMLLTPDQTDELIAMLKSKLALIRNTGGSSH